MKKLIAIICLIACHMGAQAQVAHWVLHPNFKDVKAYPNGLFRVINDEGQYAIYDNLETERYVADSISGFSEGFAMVVNRGNGQLNEFLDSKVGSHTLEANVFMDGKKPVMVDGGYEVITTDGRLSDGHIILKGINSGLFYIVNPQTDKRFGPFSRVDAFSGGYARVRAFFDPYKMKDEFLSYFSARTDEFDGLKQEIDPTKFDFLSAPTKEKALVCVDKKFYVFHFDTRLLEEVWDSTMKKKPVQVTAQSHDILLTETADGYSVTPNPKSKVTFLFDRSEHLTGIVYPSGYERKFEVEVKKVPKLVSKIVGVKNGTGRFELHYNGEMLLPAQFQAIQPIGENDAIVKRNDKWGVLHVNPDEKFQIEINDGFEMVFEHEFYQADVVLKYPTSFAKEKIEYLQAIDDDNCKIKDDKRTDNDTNPQIHSTKYENCVFTIPDITNETTPITYEFEVGYDGLLSKKYPVVVNERYHDGVYNVPNVTNKSYKDGKLTLEFEVVPKGNDNLNPYDVYVIPAVQAGYDLADNDKADRIAYGQYKADLLNSESEETIDYYIVVKEQGCPEVYNPDSYTIPKPVVKKEAAEPQRAARTKQPKQPAPVQQQKKKIIIRKR